MVDTEAYKMICPDTKIAQQHLRNAFGAVAMALDEPPEERDVLLVVPTTIMAHNLEEKQWSELLVDRIAVRDEGGITVRPGCRRQPGRFGALRQPRHLTITVEQARS